MTTSTPQDRFEDRLLAAILDDFENLTEAPASQTRQRALPVLLAAGTAVAAGAAGVVVLGHHGPHTTTHTTTHSTTGSTASSGTRPQSAADLAARMHAAVNGNDAVLNIVEHAPDSQTGKPVFDETWSTPHGDTSRFDDLDPSGEPTEGYILTITAHRTISIAINYRNRTWSKTTYPFGSATSPGSAPAPAPLPVTPEQSAARLRAQVAAGKVSIVGPTVVDGQHAIELKQISALGQLKIWVDPATYLPIREISTPPGVPETSDRAIRDDYQWLPETPANLSLVTAIPAGFTQVGPS